MPQMKPLNWLYLFITFSLITYLMNILNFFIFSPSSFNSLYMNKTSQTSFKWKW